jgi:hypothetical protein
VVVFAPGQLSNILISMQEKGEYISICRYNFTA